MAIEIQVPALGESVAEATLGAWLCKPGERVRNGQPLCELETDKVNLEVPAPGAGRLEEILVEAGATVVPGTVLARFEEGAAAAPVAAPAVAPVPQSEPGKDIRDAPSARRILAEKGIDPASVTGTGRDGRIMKADALAAAPTPDVAPDTAPDTAPAPAAAPAEAPASETRVPMTRLRQTIARRLKQAQETAAILTTFNEVDMSEAMALRTQYRDAFEKRHGVRLGFMGFFVSACVQALKEIPAVNAEIDGTDIVYRNRYDIGVAVGTPTGLVVPVVRGCDSLGLAGIEKAIAAHGARAREGRLEMADLTGGTFTISNGGVYGSLMSTPILNPPQSGILGMHRIQQRPVALDGAVVIRPMMYLALSYDHRIVDGREAVTFLVRVKECVENPSRLLLDL